MQNPAAAGFYVAAGREVATYARILSIMRVQDRTRAVWLVLLCSACSDRSGVERDGGVRTNDAESHVAGRENLEAGGSGGSDDAGPAEAGAADDPKPAISLCDGSPDVRLKYETVVQASGVDNGRDLRFDNYFIVRGDCTYGILLDGWREARTGTLSEAEAAQVTVALQYDSWAELSGRYGPSESAGPMVHVSPQRLTDGAAELVCTGACSSPNDQVHRIFVAAEASMEHWYAVGRAADGPMRVTGLIYRNNPWPSNYQAIDWPLAAQGPEYFYEPALQMSANPGALVTDPDELDTLRELRMRKQDPNFIWSLVSYVPVTTAPGIPKSRVELYFRDTTPAEE